MRLYLSGGMRGYPHHNYPLFNDISFQLRQQGLEVVNPAEIPGTSEGTPREVCMQRDIEALIGCDAIAGLPGWQMSPGAQVEVAIMWSLNKPLYDVLGPASDGRVMLAPSTVTSLFIPRETQYYKRTPLVGLCGYAQSGKDTAATWLTKNGWVRVAFADTLRQILRALNPIVATEIHQVYSYGEENPVSYASVDRRVDALVNLYGWEQAKKNDEVRALLQRLGTEAGRNIIGEHLWVLLGEQSIEAADQPVVVTDVRFPNEVQMIRRRGGTLVWVSRPDVGPVNKHASEHSVTAEDCDVVVVNDGTVVDLHEKMRLVVDDYAEAA